MPNGKVDPDTGTDTSVVVGQLSVTVAAVQLTTAPHVLASLLLLILAGVFTITGFSVSTTVTLNVHVAVPHKLLAVTVTVVTPLLKLVPLPVPTPAPVVAPLKV